MEKKTSYWPVLLYVVLLTFSIPLFFVYLNIMVEMSKEAEFTNQVTANIGTHLIYLPIILYFLAMLGVGVWNIVRSFRLAAPGSARACVNSMLILKYGMVVYFVLNFAIWFGALVLGAFGIAVATVGLGIVTWPFFIAMIPVACLLAWLAMLPGSFFGLQVARLTCKQGSTSAGGAVWHSLLQFCFFADVLDAMYLSVCKWKMGRKSSVVIALVYIIGIALFIWLWVTVAGALQGQA